MTEIGEILVGAWLKEVKKCDFIQYGTCLPENNLAGLNEIDVIGLDLKNKISYLCEVTTHIRGADYGGIQETCNRVRRKYNWAKEYASKVLGDFPTRSYTWWSPVVHEGKLTELLKGVEGEGLELVINEKYAERIHELRVAATENTGDTGNEAFRVLQILERMKKRRPRLDTTANGRPGSVQEEGMPSLEGWQLNPLRHNGIVPRRYVRGISCPRFGEEHEYEPRPGSSYEQCKKCNSTRTVYGE